MQKQRGDHEATDKTCHPLAMTINSFHESNEQISDKKASLSPTVHESHLLMAMQATVVQGTKGARHPILPKGPASTS